MDESASIDNKLKMFLGSKRIRFSNGFFRNITILKSLKRTVEIGKLSKYDLEVIESLKSLNKIFVDNTIIESELLQLRDEIIEVYSKRNKDVH